METSSRYHRGAVPLSAGVGEALLIANLVREARALGIRSAQHIDTLGGQDGRRGFRPSAQVAALLNELQNEARGKSPEPATLPAPAQTADADTGLRERVAQRLFSYDI